MDISFTAQRINEIIDLQHLVFNINNATVSEVTEKMIEMGYLSSHEKLNELIHVIENAIQHRPYNHNNIAILALSVFEKINDEVLKNHFKHRILKLQVERFSNIDDVFVISFLHKCYHLGFFTNDEIISIILKKSLLYQKTTEDNNESSSRYYQKDSVKFTYLCYFAPLLKAEVPQFYDEVLQEMINSGLPKYSMFLSKLEFFQKSKWELLETCADHCYIPGTIEWIIQNDDLEGLKEFENKPEFDANKFIFEKVLVENVPFDVNMRIQPFVFEKARILTNYPTIIQFAAFHGSVKCFTYLFKKGANTNLTDKIGINLSQFVAAGGNMDILAFYAKNRYNFEGAAHFATAYYHFDILQWLIKNKNVNIQTSVEHLGTIVHRSAASNNISILKYCFDCNCDVNIKTKYGETPLHAAAAKGQIEALKCLLNHPDIEPNAVDNDQCTPFYFAVLYHRKHVVKFLIKNERIDINKPDDEGVFIIIYQTALHIAAKLGYFDIVSIILTSNRINANYKNNNGQTPLHYASRFNQLDVVKLLLLDDRININAEDNLNQTPLYVSIMQNNVQIVQELLSSSRINPNIPNIVGYTPLHIGVELGNIECIEQLIKSTFIDVFIQDENGMTPLILSAKNGNVDAFEILKSLYQKDLNEIKDNNDVLNIYL
ncbi:hypothetical protein TRFO_21356 [Tritrichomonas foetus]|uniref:DUF3447 domain-containing protein n=1 Tax=Tritrichomonas foetus TaxID=1144522 RepID=A0A1J4KJX8_9EUKA|nr:hypothetical protein TRFO_21356 [Tritrichomonas foetus]|eukprot:OHT09645.1 hypothetical protein TRFO_21356 [Tritrichomonas foetus]